MPFRIVLLAAAFVSVACAALAQGQANPTGQWACQMTYTEFDRFGNRTSGHTREYMIAVYPNGTYEAAGMIAAADGVHQFQSQGQWNVQGNRFLAQGQQRTSSPYDFGNVPFGMYADIDPNGRILQITDELADPTGAYLMMRTIYYCERRG